MEFLKKVKWDCEDSLIQMSIKFSKMYGMRFVKICEVNGGNVFMTCQVWYVACCMPCFIYLCLVSYIYAMLYIFMPCFIYLCHVSYNNTMFFIFMPCFIYLCQCQYMLHRYSFMLHQDFHFCCIVFSHFCFINKNLCCINTRNLCCIKICQQFHFSHHPM